MTCHEVRTCNRQRGPTKGAACEDTAGQRERVCVFLPTRGSRWHLPADCICTMAVSPNQTAGQDFSKKPTKAATLQNDATACFAKRTQMIRSKSCDSNGLQNTQRADSTKRTQMRENAKWGMNHAKACPVRTAVQSRQGTNTFGVFASWREQSPIPQVCRNPYLRCRAVICKTNPNEESTTFVQQTAITRLMNMLMLIAGPALCETNPNERPSLSPGNAVTNPAHPRSSALASLHHSPSDFLPCCRSELCVASAPVGDWTTVAAVYDRRIFETMFSAASPECFRGHRPPLQLR